MNNINRMSLEAWLPFAWKNITSPLLGDIPRPTRIGGTSVPLPPTGPARDAFNLLERLRSQADPITSLVATHAINLPGNYSRTVTPEMIAYRDWAVGRFEQAMRAMPTLIEWLRNNSITGGTIHTPARTSIPPFITHNDANYKKFCLGIRNLIADRGRSEVVLDSHSISVRLPIIHLGDDPQHPSPVPIPRPIPFGPFTIIYDFTPRVEMPASGTHWRATEGAAETVVRIKGPRRRTYYSRTADPDRVVRNLSETDPPVWQEAVTTHPHIRRHVPCLGEVLPGVRENLFHFDFSIVTLLIQAMLSTYNSRSPYAPLYTFASREFLGQPPRSAITAPPPPPPPRPLSAQEQGAITTLLGEMLNRVAPNPRTPQAVPPSAPVPTVPAGFTGPTPLGAASAPRPDPSTLGADDCRNCGRFTPRGAGHSSSDGRVCRPCFRRYYDWAPSSGVPSFPRRECVDSNHARSRSAIHRERCFTVNSVHYCADHNPGTVVVLDAGQQTTAQLMAEAVQMAIAVDRPRTPAPAADAQITF